MKAEVEVEVERSLKPNNCHFEGTFLLKPKVQPTGIGSSSNIAYP